MSALSHVSIPQPRLVRSSVCLQIAWESAASAERTQATHPTASRICTKRTTRFHCTRILRILPAVSAHDPICFSLELMDLCTPPRYSAVSYICEDPSDTRVIFVNDQAMVVRVNIWNFLHRMRCSGHVGLLWIDAITINQKDLAERGSQVAVMGRIYADVSFNYTWLGSGSVETIQSLQHLNSYSESLDDDRTDPFLRPDGSPRRADLLCSMVKFTTLEYWSRVWIIQEFVFITTSKSCTKT